MSETTTEQAPKPSTSFAIHGDRAPLFMALAKAQGAFKPVVRSKTNPHFKSKYAELSDVTDATTPALSANGLCVIQPPTFAPNDMKLWEVRTILAHESGSYVEAIAYVDHIDDWHKLGSAITYCRRYCLAGVLGVAPEDDDDGNAAVLGEHAEPGPKVGTQAKPPAPKKTEPKQVAAQEKAPLRAVETPPPSDAPPSHGPSVTSATLSEIRVLIRELGWSQNLPKMNQWAQEVIGRPLHETNTEEAGQLLLADAKRLLAERAAKKESA